MTQIICLTWVYRPSNKPGRFGKRFFRKKKVAEKVLVIAVSRNKREEKKVDIDC